MTEEFELDDDLMAEVKATIKDPAQMGAFQAALREEMREATRRAAQRVAQQEQSALMAAYQSELAKVKRGDVNAIMRVKVAFRAKGLKV